MSRSVQFVLVLVLGLAGLTWGASRIVESTTQSWFERDLANRARLAVTSTRQILADAVQRSDRTGALRILEDIAHDDRIMATALCTAGDKLFARSHEYPTQFSCASVGAHLEATGKPDDSSDWQSLETLPNGEVFVSAEPLLEGDKSVGFVVLVHDVSVIQRRERSVQEFLLIAFGVLSLAAAILTSVASRLSWRGWMDEVRRHLRGERGRPEFRPFIRDMRDLLERVSSERSLQAGSENWTPALLKQTLNRHLQGEKVVIVANREPYIHEHGEDGAINVLHPASGLVTALEPVMRACSGVWVAHGSGSADRMTVDRRNRVLVPPGEESYSLRRVWLSKAEENGYYYGFANEGLWPLCHIADTRPSFRAEDWQHYQKVNAKFAAAVCDEVDTDDPIILVQDYHFALAPRMIRERLPRATIISFWHIPWPNSERFSLCPWRAELLEGMLGSSIMGFHTQLHCNNFLDAVDRFMEARIDREQNGVIYHRRSTLVRPYPISIEWPSHWLPSTPSPAEARRQVFEELGLRPDALLGVGVDRLDYTKGIEERLLAVERLLERYPIFRGRFTFAQLAAPSRTIIERYQQLNQSVERLAARINTRFGGDGYQPIILQRAHHEPPKVFRYYRAADLCYVSSLHDGMNLVAKEFVAARDDERGVLLLSHFTGAARELTEALVVNPYDIEEASSALAAALTMPADQQRDRMRAMRSLVAEFNVYRWAGRMLLDAARLRKRERLTGKLMTDFLRATGEVG